jgi:hypothetical protein
VTVVSEASGGLYRDLSGVSNQVLVEEIMALAQREDCLTLYARDSLPETAEISEFHARLQRVQDLEEYSAPAITDRVLNAAGRHYTKYPDQPVTFRSLDELVSKQSSAVVRPDTLNALGLHKPDQVLVLRAVIIATTAQEWASRANGGPTFSQRRAKLQRQAVHTLRHLATNNVYVGEVIDAESSQRFRDAYAANYLARSVIRELHMQGRLSHSSLSVDEALNIPIAFGQLVSGDQQDVVSVFPPGEQDKTGAGNLGFKPVLPTEIDEKRLARLREMQFSFGGPYTEFRYYDSIKPFKPNDEEKPKPTGGRGPEGDEENDDDEDYNYLVLEIVHPDEQGVRHTHVVADHPEKGNACYALRDEVLMEWERLLGIRLSWRDVFTQSRGTARQLGARPFHHNKGSNVEKRVHDYLRQESESLVLETFGSIFDRRQKAPFDDAMQPTKYNRMPDIMIAQIQASPVLQQIWAGIREHGYAGFHRNEAAVHRANQDSEIVRARKISLAERAQEIFDQIVAEEFNPQDN